MNVHLRQKNLEDKSAASLVLTVWAIIVAIYLFLNIDGFVYLESGIGYVRPVYWTAVILLISAFLLRKRLEFLWLYKSSIGVWSICFVGLSAIYWLFTDRTGASTAVFFQHLHFAVLLWLLICLARSNPMWVQRGIAGALICLSVSNWVEFFAPYYFNIYDCRAVGTFLNPNGTAYAMVFGVLATIGIFSQSRRPWYFVFVGASLLPTFSRSGVLIYFVAGCALLVVGVIQWRKSWMSALCGAFVVVCLFTIAWHSGRYICVSSTLSDRGKVMNEALLGTRLKAHQYQKEDGEADFSSQQRLMLAEAALKIYGKHWLLGEGLGATWKKGEQRTHNIYLEKGIEMGLLGVLMWPLFGLALLRMTTGDSRKIVYAFIPTGLLLGMFSHNIFESRALLVMAALLIAVSLNFGDNPRQKPRY